MRSTRLLRVRRFVAAWFISISLALISAAVVLADSTGTSYPR